MMTELPIAYLADGETYMYGTFQLWLKALKKRLLAEVENRQDANHTAKPTHHALNIWLAEEAYAKALKGLQEKVEGCTSEIAGDTLFPGVLHALTESLQPLGLTLAAIRIEEKSYAELKVESQQPLRLIPSFIVPRSESTCRRLSFTIVPLPLRH